MTRIHQVCPCQSHHEVQDSHLHLRCDYSILSSKYASTCTRIADFLRHEFLYDNLDRKEKFDALLQRLVSQLNFLINLCEPDKKGQLVELGNRFLTITLDDLRKKAGDLGSQEYPTKRKPGEIENFKDGYLLFRNLIYTFRKENKDIEHIKEQLRNANESLNIHLGDLTEEERSELILKGDQLYGGLVHAMFGKLRVGNPDDSPFNLPRSFSWRSWLPTIALAASIITAVGVLLVPYFSTTAIALPPLTAWETIENAVAGVWNGESSFYDAIIAPILG